MLQILRLFSPAWGGSKKPKQPCMYSTQKEKKDQAEVDGGTRETSS
jgi:hypothetical protein